MKKPIKLPLKVLLKNFYRDDVFDLVHNTDNIKSLIKDKENYSIIDLLNVHIFCKHAVNDFLESVNKYPMLIGRVKLLVLLEEISKQENIRSQFLKLVGHNIVDIISYEGDNMSSAEKCKFIIDMWHKNINNKNDLKDNFKNDIKYAKEYKENNEDFYCFLITGLIINHQLKILNVLEKHWVQYLCEEEKQNILNQVPEMIHLIIWWYATLEINYRLPSEDTDYSLSNKRTKLTLSGNAYYAIENKLGENELFFGDEMLLSIGISLLKEIDFDKISSLNTNKIEKLLNRKNQFYADKYNCVISKMKYFNNQIEKLKGEIELNKELKNIKTVNIYKKIKKL